jgi:hypothetical protein
MIAGNLRVPEAKDIQGCDENSCPILELSPQELAHGAGEEE